MSVGLCHTVPHIAVAHCGHGHDRPPEGIRDGFEEGLLRAGLGEVHDAGEEHHTWNRGRREGRARTVAVSISSVQCSDVSLQWSHTGHTYILRVGHISVITYLSISKHIALNLSENQQ